jgi:hypothetical protein
MVDPPEAGYRSAERGALAAAAAGRPAPGRLPVRPASRDADSGDAP